MLMSKLTKSFYFHVNLLFLYKLLNDKTSFAKFKKSLTYIHIVIQTTKMRNQLL